MEILTRTSDWSKTPVGPIESWPQSLRTTVTMLLASRFPMFLWWGPELIQFYNDGYRPSLGDKHPQALGQRGTECWPEIWPIIGPQIEAVMERGEATWNEDHLVPIIRNHQMEEVFWTYSYSPIRDESDGVGGVLVVVNETTGRVVGERRLRTMGALAAATTDIRTAEDGLTAAADVLGENPRDLPFVLLYLMDEDRKQAQLVACSGLEAGEDASPARVDLTLESESATDPWPLAAAAAGGDAQLVGGLRERFGTLPGPWPESPDRALVLPIRQQGQIQSIGVMVAGISARRPLDDEYRGFLELVADRIATAVAEGRSYEEDRKRAEALAELDRAKTTFFSNVSHEFRTPLTLILGTLEELMSGRTGPVPHDVLETLTLTHQNSMRLLRLVNTLLDFSSIEAGRVRATYEPTDLCALTTDLASVFRSVIESAGIDFTVTCTAIDQPVFVDRDMWEKIVLNLLSNAFKFTHEGSISVSVRPVGETVHLEIADTGVGISEDEKPRLFERFHRIENAEGRTHEGTGIGLALVQELVKFHGGSIDVDSEPGKGSTFAVSIPAGKNHLPPEAIRSRSSSASHSDSASYVNEARRWQPEPLREDAAPFDALDSEAATAEPHRGRILVADDNSDMRRYMTQLLVSQYEVVAVANGERALANVRDRAPDLVLTDVMMPVMNGFELLKALRSDPTTRGIPVIMLSARAGEESRVEGFAAGADDYVVKPFSARELLARVSTHLEIARARRETARQLQEIFQKAPAMIATLRGPDHVFESANQHYLQSIGHRDILGKSVAEALPEVVDQGIIELLDHVYETGEAYADDELLVMVDRKNDLHLDEAWFNFVYQPLFDAAGDVSGILVHAVEVTDQVNARRDVEELNSSLEQRVRQRTAQLEWANENLRKRNRELQDLADMISHDLQEPLRKITTFVDILRLDHSAAIDDEGHAYVERMQAAALRMSGLLHDIHSFSKIMTRDRAFRDVDLNAELARVLDSMQTDIQETAARIDVDTLPVIHADPEQIRLLFRHLIQNAIMFRRPDRPPVVTVRGSQTQQAEEDKSVCRIEVEDNGIGIDERYLEKIFEPFERLHDRSEYYGRGMGLAICRRIAENHLGSITARSVPNEGSQFIVEMSSPFPSSQAVGVEEMSSSA